MEKHICKFCGHPFIFTESYSFCSNENNHYGLCYWWAASSLKKEKSFTSFHLRIKNKQISSWFDNSMGLHKNETILSIIEKFETRRQIHSLPYAISPEELLAGDFQQRFETLFNFL